MPDNYCPENKETHAFEIKEEGKCISLATVRSPLPGYVFINVETKREYQGKGYAREVVSAATQWILNQNAVAHYSVRIPNTPSIRIARRLGFVLTSQMLTA